MADAPAGTDTSTTDDGATDTSTTDKPDATSDLGDKGKQAIAAERKRADDAVKANKALEARLKAIEDKDKSDLEKANEAATTAAKERDDARRDAMRERIGREKKLPDVMVARLQGETEDEMRADADSLAEVVKQRIRPSGDVDAGRQGTPPAKTARDEFAALMGRQIAGTPLS